MNDDRFEHELRGSLVGLAREPAPERLVERVSEIPSREPSRLVTRARLNTSTIGGPSLALLAASVAIAIVAIFARPGSSGPSNIGPSPSLTGVLPGATATAETSASSRPSVSPGSSATAATTPSAKPERVPVPSGFEPISATFVSTDHGWVLGSVPCDAGRCPAIVTTLDGGATWSSAGAPATSLANGSPPSVMSSSGVSGLRFADAMSGWAFGPELWTTHDGGASWVRVAIDGLPAAATVVALETGAGKVHAVAYGGAQDFQIASSDVDAENWQVAAVRVPVGAGPVPEIQLVLSGPAGWVLENDRTVVAGAMLQTGSWRSWQPVCLDVVGPAVLAASSQDDLVALCDVGLWGNPTGVHLFVSSDGGASFAETGPRLPGSAGGAVATADRSTIVATASGPSGSALVASFDGGQTWSSVQNAGTVSVRDLGFTTPNQGIVVTTDDSGAGRLLMTRDGGRTWTPVGF